MVSTWLDPYACPEVFRFIFRVVFVIIPSCRREQVHCWLQPMSEGATLAAHYSAPPSTVNGVPVAPSLSGDCVKVYQMRNAARKGAEARYELRVR
jgi:hypothetical protein